MPQTLIGGDPNIPNGPLPTGRPNRVKWYTVPLPIGSAAAITLPVIAEFSVSLNSAAAASPGGLSYTSAAYPGTSWSCPGCAAVHARLTRPTNAEVSCIVPRAGRAVCHIRSDSRDWFSGWPKLASHRGRQGLLLHFIPNGSIAKTNQYGPANFSLMLPFLSSDEN
jgi:hypothetical protein